MDLHTVVKFDFLTAVRRYDKKIIATGSFSSLDKSVDLATSCLLISHIPCHLNQPTDLHAALNHKITFTFSLIIKYTVNRSSMAVKLQKYGVFKFLAIIPAHRQQHRIAQTIVNTIIFRL